MYFMGNIGRAEIHHLLYAEIQQGAYLLTKTLVLILTKPMIRQRKRVEWMDIRLVPIINPCARLDQANCLMKSIQITGQGGKRVQGGGKYWGVPSRLKQSWAAPRKSGIAALPPLAATRIYSGVLPKGKTSDMPSLRRLGVGLSFILRPEQPG